MGPLWDGTWCWDPPRMAHKDATPPPHGTPLGWYLGLGPPPMGPPYGTPPEWHRRMGPPPHGTLLGWHLCLGPPPSRCCPPPLLGSRLPPALAMNPSQNLLLPILIRFCARSSVTSTSCCPPPEGRKDSGPHRPPSNRCCSPDTNTGCGGGERRRGGGVSMRAFCHRGPCVMGGGGGGEGSHLALPPVLLEQRIAGGVGGVLQPQQPPRVEEAV